MDKESPKLLLIMNPKSGTMQAPKYMTDIIQKYCDAGYVTTVMLTKRRGDAREFAREFSGLYDLVVVSGGDGTFNEVVDGIVLAGTHPKIGYIPSGSTNDFANSLGLPRFVLDSADKAISGERCTLDVGSFNGRTFSYVASFGAFTSTAYTVPQNIKNILGHTAYVLQGVKDIVNIRSVHAKIIADEGTDNETVCEDDYIFGAVCNATSVGGILDLKRFDIDMNDGLMEVLLVKTPKNIIEMNDIIFSMLNGKLETGQIEFFSARDIRVEIEEGTAWTLDGEYEEGKVVNIIRTVPNAIELMK